MAVEPQRFLHLAKRRQWPALETALVNLKRQKVRCQEIVEIDEETGLTLLMMACKDSRRAAVEALLDLNVDVNEKTEDGMTALHFAVVHCMDIVIENLLKHNADPMAIGGDDEQMPIHIACQRHAAAFPISKLVLAAMSKDARLIPDRRGFLPITYAVENSNPALAKELLTEFATRQAVDWRDESTANTLLHLATLRHDPKMASILVTVGRANVDAQNNKGQTALHLAAANNDEVMARCLHTLHANANIVDHEEQTCLHVAAKSGNAIVVELMVDRMKADVQARITDGSTLMHLAAEYGHVDNVLVFVKRGVPLHMPNKAGVLSLHLAAKNGHTEVVRTLLQNGAPINARTKGRLTAIHLAVLYNKPDVIELLMGFGANVDVKGGQHGETPLHIAAKTNSVECAKMLLLSGAHVNATTGDDQETALHMAARLGHEDVVELLLEEGANIQMLSQRGESALHQAVRHAHFPIVRILIEHVQHKMSKRDVIQMVNMATSEGETSLHLACELVDDRVHYPFEDVDIAEILLKNGADPTASTKHTSEIPLHYSARVGNLSVTLVLAKFMGHNFSPLTNRQAKDGQSPLLTACHHGHSDMVQFLTRHNARVDLFDDLGSAALHLAAEKGFISCCEILLDQKAFVNAKTKAGMTPLHLAAGNGFKELTVLLVEKYHAAIDSPALDKKTPLHLAAENGHRSVAHSLMSLKANVNAKDSLGQTPFHLAAESDHPEVIKMFLKYQPELVFTATQDGMTCAHIAAAKGSVAVIKELMRFNKMVVSSARNKTSDSLPLHLAAAGGHGDVVRILLDAGSSPFDENADGMTCIHLAAKEGYSTVLAAIPASVSWSLRSVKNGLTPLHVAAFYAKTEMVSDLLARVPPDITTKHAASFHMKDENLKALIMFDYGLTPLHVASYAGVDQVVRLLLNLPGVDAEATTATTSSTPLHLAALMGSVVVASLLLSKSAALLNQQDARGLKPLHIAARSGHADMVASLVGQGSDINTSDNHGWVPLHHACRCGQLGVVKLLLELGASVTHATRDDRVPLSLAAASGHVDVFMFLLGKEHDTEKLLDDPKFVFDLMTCGRMNKQQAIVEFILVSKSPLGTAALLSHLFLRQAEEMSEHAKDFETASRFCEKITSSLMSIGALQTSPIRLLQATDSKGKQFVDALLDDNLKAVVAESAVQRYLTDIWAGDLHWSNFRLTFLFFAFVFCPPVLAYFTLPLSHGYNRVPIIKFMSYLASHIQFIAVLCTVAVVPMYPITTRDNFYPTWNEFMLAIFLGGNLTAELTNPSSGSGSRSGTLKTIILSLSAAAYLLQVLAITFDVESFEASILMYIRNQVFSIPVMLSVFYLVEFLTFHHRFGPLTIILNYIIQETVIATSIMLIFFVGWWLQLQVVYSPICPDLEPELTNDCICNVRVPPGCETPFIASILHPGIPGCRTNAETVQMLTTNFQILYGALLHHGDYIWQTAVRNSPEWATAFTRFQMSTFHIIMVLTILTLIISTTADTYERMNRRSDLEWKFERAKLIRNMIKTAPMPSPFNLLVKPVIYLKALVKRKRLLCTAFASYYMMLEDVEDDKFAEDEEMGDARPQQTEARFTTRVSRLFSRRATQLMSGIEMQSASGGDVPTTPAAVAPRDNLAMKPGEKHAQETLQEVINWHNVVERYREIESEEKEDEYIEELGCLLSELEEWQAELWEEATEVEKEEEREIFRNWLIEEFKEVIKS